MIKFDGRVAIVTGAGSGLGRAHAMALAERGARVVVNDLNREAAEAVCETIRRLGGQALPFAGSVTASDQVDAMVSATLSVWGQVDILVNNAGILRDRTFAKLSVEDFQAVVDVHLMGAVHCTRAVWEPMRQAGFGRIIFTSSSSGLYGNFGQSNYGAAKMALVGLMQTLAIEGEKYGIRVNCLAPSATTAMTENIFDADTARNLDPALVSPGVVYLASDNAPTRMILLAGGGSFEAAHITMTKGVFVGGSSDAADILAARIQDVASRDGEMVPQRGAEQSMLEFARAQEFAGAGS